MKKVFFSIAAIILFAVSFALVICTIAPRFSMLLKANESKASASENYYDSKNKNIKEYSVEYNDYMFFSSIDEYLRFLNIYSYEDAEYDTSRIYNWSAESVPTDAQLVNIFVNSESTVFNYYLEREFDVHLLQTARDGASNFIDIYPDDNLIDGLLHALIEKEYTTDANNITDVEQFVANLAGSIGCDLYSDLKYITIYQGEINVRDHTGNNSVPLEYLVGYQTIVYTHRPNQTPSVVYTYTPVSLSETEISSIINVIEDYLCDNNTY